MALRGALHPLPEDNVPPLPDGAPAATLVLLGWTGGRQWPAFAASAEAQDRQPHPLDRWSRRLVDAAAAALGAAGLDAVALYLFGRSAAPQLPTLGALRRRWRARRSAC